MLSKFINWLKPLKDAEVQLKDKKQIAKKYTLWRIKMFFGMYFGYVVYYLTRKNLSYIAPSFTSGTGITMIQYGTLGTVMYISYGIGKFLSGTLADKCNIRAFMALGLIVSSVISLFFSYLSSFFLIAFFWGVNGVFQSMGFPPVAKGLVYWFSPSERATKWTLWSSSHTVGTFLVAPLVVFCLSIGNWHAVFYIPGIIGIITGIILLLTLTDKPSSVGLPPIETYKNDTLPTKKQSSLSHKQILLKYVFRNPYLWSLGISYIFIYFIRFCTLDWTTIFMTQRGISEKTAAFLLGFMPLIGSLGGISSGWISEKFFKGRCAPISIIYLLCLIFSLWGMYRFTFSATPLWIIAAFLSLVGFFIDGPQNLVGGVEVSRLTVQESVGAAVGFAGMFGYLGAALSGRGAAYILQKWSWYGVFLTCGISCLVASLFVAFTWKKEFTTDKEQHQSSS